MEETYTYFDDLVQFVYHEMSPENAVEMTHLIDEDPSLRAVFNDILMAKTQLPKVLFNPSQKAISNILQYSANTAVEA